MVIAPSPALINATGNHTFPCEESVWPQAPLKVRAHVYWTDIWPPVCTNNAFDCVSYCVRLALLFRLIAHCATGPVNTASQTEWAVRQLHTDRCFFFILFIQHANHALTTACQELVYYCLAATWCNSLILQSKNFQKITKMPLLKFLKTRWIQGLCLCLRKSWNIYAI